MPSREEIREGIAETLYRFEYDGWDRLSAGGRVMWLSRAAAVMNKEHSQGVVIKRYGGCKGCPMVAVEPLIKEE